MMSNLVSIILVLLAAASCSAFAPSGQIRVATTTGLAAFDGKRFDASKNPLARGGKNSWEFELDTMYVEEPKARKVVAPKKTAPKAKVIPKSPWNATPKKLAEPKASKATNVVAPKSKAFSPFATKAAPVKEEPKKNPFLAFFQK